MQTPRILALFAVVAIAGCGAHSTTPSTSSSPTAATLSPAADTNPQPAPAEVGGATATDDAPPPDQDGNPRCAAYDGWRPGPDEAGIAVIYWNAGPDHVTVVVRQQDGPDLSQTADIDTGERMHEFDFIDGDPTAVTEVLIMTDAVRCFVRAAPLNRRDAARRHTPPLYLLPLRRLSRF